MAPLAAANQVMISTLVNAHHGIPPSSAMEFTTFGVVSSPAPATSGPEPTYLLLSEMSREECQAVLISRGLAMPDAVTSTSNTALQVLGYVDPLSRRRSRRSRWDELGTICSHCGQGVMPIRPCLTLLFCDWKEYLSLDYALLFSLTLF